MIGNARRHSRMRAQLLLVGMGSGAALGLIAGLLMARRPGAELRKDIASAAAKGRDWFGHAHRLGQKTTGQSASETSGYSH